MGEEAGCWRLFLATGLPQAYLAARGWQQARETAEPRETPRAAPPPPLPSLQDGPCPGAPAPGRTYLKERAMHINTAALVLRSVDYKESDRILTLLTRDMGKVTAAARGSRKKGSPIAAGTQLLCWSDVTLYEYRGRWAVQEAATQRQFRGMRRDLEKFALGCYAAEVAEALSLEDVPTPELLSLTLNTLHALDVLSCPPALVKGAFELRSMCQAGYEPALDGCVVCGGEPREGRFHLKEGVLHCAACRGGVGEGISLPVSGAVLAAMRHVAWGEAKKIFSFRLEGESLGQFAGVCEAYLLTQLERGFRTLDFYKQLTLPLQGAAEKA